MTRKIKAIVFTAPGQIELQFFELPPCGPKEVVCETRYTFVSPGTELRILSGAKESKGRFPVIPGYSWVGQVVEVGSELKGWEAGEWVTGRNSVPVPGSTPLWGGQASHHRCEVTGLCSVLKLPAGAVPWDYVTVEVGAISWRGVTIAYPAPGETAVVVGQGLVGALVARWLLWHGARVIVTDLEEQRLERARKWGVAAAVNGRAPDARERMLAYCDGGADIVIEASASLAGVRLASSLVRQPAARTLNSAYPAAALHADAHYWPRLVYLATYTQTLEAAPGEFTGGEGALVMKPADRTVGDRLAVIERIRHGDLPVGDILEAPVPVAEAPAAYARLRDAPDRTSALAFLWTP